MTQKNLFLGLVLETLHQCDKRFKAKSQNVLKANSYIGEVTGVKLVGETFFPAMPSRIRLTQYLKIAGYTMNISSDNLDFKFGLKYQIGNVSSYEMSGCLPHLSY